MGREEDLVLAGKIAELAAQHRGRAYYVGGFVRDRLRGEAGKDIDLEIHGLSPEQLEEILKTLGTPLEMGRSFGIRSLRGSGLDIALPRKKTGTAGSGDGEPDPFCGPEQAARRRDFTCNALLQDVLTGEILDPFGGAEDIRKGVLRHVDPQSFRQDPLRVLRCARFAARFQWQVEGDTLTLCRSLDLSGLPRERIFGEVEKALLQSEKPSVFFSLLRQMDQLSCWFPELQALIGVPQSPRYHAEGDVWNHTMMVLDEALQFLPRVENPLGFLLGAVTHDFGKVLCTEEKNGEIHAYGHEVLGLPLAERFLRRLTGDRKLIRYVLNLTEYHMKPNVLAGAGASLKSSNKLLDRALDPEALISIALADGLGKLPRMDPEPNRRWLEDRLQLYRATMAEPFVGGRDLAQAGVAPGPAMGACLEYAHKLRLAGVQKDSAMKQVLAMARKNHFLT